MRTVIVRPPISAPFMICVAACASSGVEYLTVPKPLHMHTWPLTLCQEPLMRAVISSIHFTLLMAF